VNPTHVENLIDHIKGKGLNLLGYAPGYSRDSDGADMELMQEAVHLCAGADVVLLCMGLDECSEIEGQDRTHLELPESHTTLLQAISRVNSNIVLVISGGAPFCMPESKLFRAAIHGYLAGQAGSGAMADALTGIVNPSGKLNESWPLKLEDTPCHRYYPGKERTCEYREGLYVGYRYYDTAGIPVRYPFGHGLSYTAFSYSDLNADEKQVTFTLTNTGRVAGAEVAQVYIGCKNSRIYRPRKELKGFVKVLLAPGESKKVTVPLDDKAFRYFDIHTGNFEVETGEYEISVAASVSDVKLTGTIPQLIGSAETAAENLPNYACGNVTDICDAEFAALLGRPIPDGRWTEEIDINDPLSRLGEAKGALARFGFKMLKKKMDSDPSDSMMLYVFHLPLRAVAKTTAGAITENMAKDIQDLANGHAVAGLCRLIGHHFSDKKKMKAFQAKLEK
jgi:beta-glucosidase